MTIIRDVEQRHRVKLLSRAEFLDMFADDYQPGQHLTALGPTGRGKSTLCFQCLDRVISPDMRVASLHGKIKGRDPVIPVAARHLGLRMVEEMPSRMRQRIDGKSGKLRNGYIVRPLTKAMTAAEENAKLERNFRAPIHQNYADTKHKSITHINEAHQAQQELHLREAIEAPLQRGGPDNAVWSEAQRGRYLSFHTYGAAEHMLIFYDDDADTRKRYGDFGAADAKQIVDITSRLKTKRVADGRTISQALYIRRGGGMYLVDT